MSRCLLLDSGSLGMVSNPKASGITLGMSIVGNAALLLSIGKVFLQGFR